MRVGVRVRCVWYVSIVSRVSSGVQWREFRF